MSCLPLLPLSKALGCWCRCFLGTPGLRRCCCAGFVWPHCPCYAGDLLCRGLVQGLTTLVVVRQGLYGCVVIIVGQELVATLPLGRGPRGAVSLLLLSCGDWVATSSLRRSLRPRWWSHGDIGSVHQMGPGRGKERGLQVYVTGACSRR